MTNELPRWEMGDIYPAIDSPEFEAAVQEAAAMLDGLEAYLQAEGIAPDQQADRRDLPGCARKIAGVIQLVNEAQKLIYTIDAYLSAFISTDSYNETAAKTYSAFEPLEIRLTQLEASTFRGWLGQLREQMDALTELDPLLAEHAFYLKETAEQSRYLMSAAEEALAGELSLSGVRAWSKLQNEMTSQLSWPIKIESGAVEEWPLTAIMNLRGNPDETMRRRGYEAEMQAWASRENIYAACLNGVKGAQNTLFNRRGREDYLQDAISKSRLDRATLEAMLSAMKASFPLFRRYFKAKAKRMGKTQLPWWDLFAPIGKTSRSFSYPEAQQFVLDNFALFSEDLAELANTAYTKNWIDVGPRKGKSAGAFCMQIPANGDSRVMLNFEGDLDWVFTLAHELGHAFHNECLRGKSMLQSDTPMTLAETASIMCETIVTDAAIKQAANPQEELAILETSLIGSSQVVVDIYSRFLFESEVFKRRGKGALPASELNEIMEWAQAETYGEGLDPAYRHKYMWTWKPHYYGAELSFYNYPYAFGLLFATGLYAIYQQHGQDFVPDYMQLLGSTGMGNAADLAAGFGINLRDTAFWEGSLGIIGKQVDRYEGLE